MRWASMWRQAGPVPWCRRVDNVDTCICARAYKGQKILWALEQ